MNNFESYGGMTPQKEQELMDEKKIEQELMDENITKRGKEVFLHGLRMLEALRSMKATNEKQDKTYFDLVEIYKKEHDPNYESGFSTKQELDEFTSKYVLHEKEEKVQPEEEKMAA
jgi:hypothetical protein